MKTEEKKLITNFLDWYYKEGSKNPLRFETDHDDIAKMFLFENPQFQVKGGVSDEEIKNKAIEVYEEFYGHKHLNDFIDSILFFEKASAWMRDRMLSPLAEKEKEILNLHAITLQDNHTILKLQSELEAVKRERDFINNNLLDKQLELLSTRNELKSQAEKKVDFGTQTFRNVQTASKVELILKPEHMNTLFTWKQIQDAIIADNPTTN